MGSSDGRKRFAAGGVSGLSGGSASRSSGASLILSILSTRRDLSDLSRVNDCFLETDDFSGFISTTSVSFFLKNIHFICKMLQC